MPTDNDLERAVDFDDSPNAQRIFGVSLLDSLNVFGSHPKETVLLTEQWAVLHLRCS